LSLAKGNPIAYARALADLEELRHDLNVVAPALGAGGGVLLARIRRTSVQKVVIRTAQQRLAILLTIARCMPGRTAAAFPA